MLAWCPDWPVIASARDAGVADHKAIAIIEKSLVFACSPAARAEGVSRGMRARAAQARCTELVLLDYDRSADSRLFEPVVQGVEASMAGVQLVRPGMLAMAVRGPARYYGGEQAAARLLVSKLAELGVPAARVGIADGPFAAEQAATGPAGADRCRGRVARIPRATADCSPWRCSVDEPADAVGHPNA